jgi:4-amino-4-deoxy-L-arabinose transferase-like glycosyltransferase
MTFSLFSLFAWLGWTALIMGWPEKLARQANRLAPGFSGEFRPLPFIVALLVTAAWTWLLTTGQRQRSPWRGLVHWLGGLTALWLLLMTLWLPWIEYGKSYRSVGTALKRALPEKHGCVAGRNISDANRALIDYYAGVAIRNNEPPGRCGWLLVLRDAPDSAALDGWIVIAEMSRPRERNERFVLYRRAS